MRRNVSFLFCAAVLTLFGSTSTASADLDDNDRYDPRRLYGGLWLGFSGDAEADGDDQFSGDLDTTLGGQVGMDWVAQRWISLGFEARLGAARWERMKDRSKIIDLDFKPRFRFFSTGPIELYATTPVGLTIPRLADFDNRPLDGNIGWNFGVGAGINVFLTDSFGLNAEPIWLMHKFGVGGDADGYTLKQFSVMLNAVILL
jgi:hypothetical protein